MMVKVGSAALVTVALGCGIPDLSGVDGGSTRSAAGGGDSASSGGGGSGAAGGAASRDELYTAGSRLKVRSLVASDGARMQAGFWDSVRNEACSFLPASDGKMRCLPTAADAYPVSGQFVDSQCTSEAFFSTLGTECTHYGRATRTGAPGTCPGIYHYELHTLAPVTTIYAISGTTCKETPTTPAVRYFRSTGIIEPEVFVEASYVVAP